MLAGAAIKIRGRPASIAIRLQHQGVYRHTFKPINLLSELKLFQTQCLQQALRRCFLLRARSSTSTKRMFIDRLFRRSFLIAGPIGLPCAQMHRIRQILIETTTDYGESPGSHLEMVCSWTLIRPKIRRKATCYYKPVLYLLTRPNFSSLSILLVVNSR